MVWSNTHKEIIGYCFAALSLIVGFGLAIAGFIVEPTGVISESVLWLLSQCLVFAGAICGVSLHVNNQMKKVETAVYRKLKKSETENTDRNADK